MPRLSLDEGVEPSCIIEGDVYKHTIVGDYVVKRHVSLYRDHFITRRPSDPSERRVFSFSPSARLVPADRKLIEQRRRHVRPPGVGSMTALAAIRGKGTPVELWTFKLESDYDFKFCFEDQETAYKWHELLTSAIRELQLAEGGPAARTQEPQQQQRQQQQRQQQGALSSASAVAAAEAASAAAAAARHRRTSSGGELPSSLGGASPAGGNEPSWRLPLGNHLSKKEREEEELQRIMNFSSGNGSGDESTQRYQPRWVPYRHSNGLAIYGHRVEAPGAAEFMVSTVVRGGPLEVLRALLDPQSATTILGPALEVEVLDSVPGKQVLRLQVQAVGSTAEWFRPREAVVQRLIKKESDGVYVVLFSSVEHAAAAARVQQRREGVIEVSEALDSVRRSNPIRCKVSGGYTISKLAGSTGENSSETLLTCILQVEDMGGWLNPSHPLFRLVNWWSGGAYDAFLERMLLTCMLVRDQVEKSRFAVKPLLFNVGPEGSDEEQLGAEAAGAPAQGIVPRTSTFVIRQAAAAEDASSAGKGAAAAGASPFAPLADTPYSSASMTRSAEVRVKSYHKTRLASLRLPDRIDSGSVQAPLVPALGSLQEDLGVSVAQEQQWDSSFKLPKKFYCEIHTPGTDHPFKVRGPNYLSDGVKVAAGEPVFELLGLEVVDTGGSGPLPHISRFLPSVRRSSKPFVFVYNLMVPGPPTMCCVFVFGADAHPNALGPPPDDPEDCDWEPFDFLMWRFLHGDDDERRSLFKMIPRIAEGSWVIKQSVGTTPVVIGRKLTTSFFITDKYAEVAVDVGSSTTAQYVTGMVRGGCKNLVLDLGLVLEGHNSWELPEVLLGAVRVNKLDLVAASKLDDSQEVPILHVPGAQAHAGAAAAGARSELSDSTTG